jgi:hypothetical protein
MSNPQKQKGTRWESAVRDYLQDRGLPARRNAQHGAQDVGDLSIEGYPFALEAKDHARIELASFVDQANREAHNARVPYGAAVVKRRGKGVHQAYVVMDLETFTTMLLSTPPSA